MPFGLCNAPATFQRLMEQVLPGLQWRILALYLDGIIIFAKMADEHLERLRIVFERCRSAALKLKPRKCDFLRRSVSFLGHVIDEDGLHTDPDIVKRIVEWTTPENVSHIRSFVGLTSYYRRFIPNYAAIVGPLSS